MSDADAVKILNQMMDVMIKMRDITPADGEVSPEQREELQRLYDEKVVPLTDLARDVVNDG